MKRISLAIGAYAEFLFRIALFLREFRGKCSLQGRIQIFGMLTPRYFRKAGCGSMIFLYTENMMLKMYPIEWTRLNSVYTHSSWQLPNYIHAFSVYSRIFNVSMADPSFKHGRYSRERFPFY